MTLHTCTFRPIPYVVPPLYCLCVLFMILYSAANTFRAWIAYEEKKISKPFRLFCQICYVNLAIAGLLFSLCFAVQPHDHESLIVHTGPFAYFTIALVMNQVSSFNSRDAGVEGGCRLCPPHYYWPPQIFERCGVSDTMLKCGVLDS